MPKKMGINSKAQEARDRKQDAKKIAQDRAMKDAEDKMWHDDDKSLAKKKQRKEEEDRKKAEALKRKAEAKLLLDEEMSSIKVEGKQSIQKVTRQQVQEEIERRTRNVEKILAAKNTTTASSAAPTKLVVAEEPPIEENLNRVMADTIIATNVDEALAVLSVKDGADNHPEKRMRAAFKAYESANLPRIKAENPSMRLSQWKQILMKEWNKSPENPFNQRF